MAPLFAGLRDPYTAASSEGEEAAKMSNTGNSEGLCI